MSKLDKFKQILSGVQVGSEIAGGFGVPGASALSKITDILGSHPNTPASTASAESLKHLAEADDEIHQMIFAMANEIAALKAEVAELKNR